MKNLFKHGGKHWNDTNYLFAFFFLHNQSPPTKTFWQISKTAEFIFFVKKNKIIKNIFFKKHIYSKKS